MIKVLRMPNSRFENLSDFDLEPTYTTITDEDRTELRMHSGDPGPRDADPILPIHGNPTLSYLYRQMLPPLLKSGRRVIAVTREY
jgi:haloalkane dehalogenase